MVVIDSGGGDHTSQRARASGARAWIRTRPARIRTGMGKGDAMWRALDATGGDVVCFLDGDTEDPHPHHLRD